MIRVILTYENYVFGRYSNNTVLSLTLKDLKQTNLELWTDRAMRYAYGRAIRDNHSRIIDIRVTNDKGHELRRFRLPDDEYILNSLSVKDLQMLIQKCNTYSDVVKSIDNSCNTSDNKINLNHFRKISILS